ncbi:MAG: hypothetical protein ACRCYZ_01475 [Alphaproteobacteria bacterium]
MSKKIVSSLIIAGFCFNSLPVYAVNLSLREQEQQRNMQVRQSNFSNQRRSNVSGPMDPPVLLAGLFLSLLKANEAAPTGSKKKSNCDTKQHSQDKLKKYFASSGAIHAYILPVPRISVLSSGEIEADYGSMALSLNDFQSQIENQQSDFFASSIPSGGDCAIYQIQSRDSSLFGLGDRHEDGFLETIAKKTTKEKICDFFNSRNKQHIVLPSQGTFGFVKLLPNIEGDKSKGIFRASLGHNRLSLSAYNDAKILSPHLMAFYALGETHFALRNGDDYIELRTEPGNQLGQLGNEATYFLKSLFEGAVIKNYFSKEIAKTFITEQPSWPAISFAPEPNLSNSLNSTGVPQLSSAHEQLPGTSSSNYSFKDISIGASGLGGTVALFTLGACTLKKCFGGKKRSNRRQEDTEIRHSIINNASSSLQFGSFLSQTNQNTKSVSTNVALEKDEYEVPRTFFSASTLSFLDARSRPDICGEMGKTSQSGKCSGSTGSNDSGVESGYLEMHPFLPKANLGNAAPGSSLPEVSPHPTSNKGNRDTLPSPESVTIVQA